MPVGQIDAAGRLIDANEPFRALYGLRSAVLPIASTALGSQVAEDSLADLLSRAAAGVHAETIDGQTADGRRIGVRRIPLPAFAGTETAALVHTIEAAGDRAPQATDPLTGLAGRGQFLATLDRHVAEAAETFDEVALLYLDLDRFKPVNDTLGHEVGDRLLREVARRLASEIRPGDVLGRLGGDEFALLQTDGAQPGASRALGRRIIDTLSKPFHLDGHTVSIGVSIGAAVAPFDASTSGDLVRAADLAMYSAKQAGRNTLRYFEPELQQAMEARRDTEAELRDAVPSDQLRLRYQPAKDMLTGRVTCVEALVRWEHPTLGFVPPDRFIPLAEDSGLIVPIGEWVLRRACRDAAAWPDGACVAVNVSAVQLRNRSFVQTVLDALEESGLPARRLELEITESALMADTELTIAILAELRAAGVRIAMDDFGTGYSSINYLRRFPFDKIKIDRSFVSGTTPDSESAALIRMIAALGSSLCVQTTAEGVETDSEMEIVRAAGCSQMQGYLLSQPVAADELAPLLQRLADADPAASAY